jgi:hypothetical protein
MLVVIHGWSDSSKSFEKLSRHLAANGIEDVRHIRLGNYVSLDDDVTFDDLAAALEKAWTAQKIPVAPRTVDVIVHSTGALVIRHWMTRYKTATTNPVFRLLMLAPANFGSPLAHKGRSFVGRVVKGFKSDRRFQTGEKILMGLEMASPFSWQLALRDRFSATDWYGPGRILCTVLVGSSGYTGISAAANEDGSDGTVLVSTANLNPILVEMDFCNDPQKPVLKVTKARGATAFVRLNPENHSSIAYKERDFRSNQTLGFIKAALSVTDATFDAHVANCDAVSAQMRAASASEKSAHGFQNTVVRLTDSQDDNVADYFLEFFAKQADRNVADDKVTAVIQERVLGKVHVYSENCAYRSIKFDTTTLASEVQAKDRPLYVSITAMPDVRKTRSVGYSTFGWDDIGSIKLTVARQNQLFAPDRTALIDIKIRREQTEKVFEILPLGA